jgi:quercetin dioxygenase-like cupin family protein
MRNQLEQYQENVKHLSAMTARMMDRPSECGQPKVFDLAGGGEAHVWVLFEKGSVSIVKSYVTPDSEFPLHRHGAKEIIVLFEGSATYESGDISKRMEPGDCVSVPAGKAHRMLSHSEGAWFSVTTVPREEGLGDGR